MRNIDTIIIHCAATKPSMNIGVNTIRKWHVEERGWSDIGYHDVIRLDGTIEKGRPIERSGAHARGHNASSIGICLIGGMDMQGNSADTFNGLQFASLRKLVAEYEEKYDIKKVIGHNEVSKKDCPCFDVRQWHGS